MQSGTVMSPPPHSVLSLVIDLDAIVRNWRFLKAKAGPAACAAVVKANAYGLGLDKVAPRLVEAGCDIFCVATIDEGVALRGIAPDVRIFVLSGPPPGGEGECAAHRLIPSINSMEQLAGWRAFAARSGHLLDTALHVDSGMTRLGLDTADVAALAADASLLAGIRPVLGMTHLACADTSDHDLNRRQLAAFTDAMAMLPPMPRSIAASSGMFLGDAYRCDLVRPGAALYGVNPVGEQPNPMAQTVVLRAKILQIRDVDTPQCVGYGATHSVASPGRIATVGIGYADGFLRTLGNSGYGVLGGLKVPVVGRISMDLTTFDISMVPADQARPGDWLDLIGPDHTIDELAAEAGTIAYEILTGLSSRAHREYAGAYVGGAA